MKAYFEKAVFNFSSRMRRRQISEGVDCDEQELTTVSLNERESSVDRSLDLPQIEHSPSPILSPVSPFDTMEADDILFRKNNVCLKYPRKNSLKSFSSLPRSRSRYSSSPSSSLGESGDSLTDKDATPKSIASSSSTQDNQILIPGFLFITTRGSDFGTTLILNWAPNSSMHVPDTTPKRGSVSSVIRSNSSSTSTSSGSERHGLGFPDLVPSPQTVSKEDPEVGAENVDLERPSCSSVSIDLGMMEVIRIFYRMDDNAFILSGEMVITSKDRNFKVFHFKNGGLNDLIHLFRSWKYFKHHCHKETHQHTFTIFRPKLSLSELHPEEGTVKSMLMEDTWRNLLDAEGKIVDGNYVRKIVFFQGVSPTLRKDVWPFLLHLYSFDSTQRERARIRAIRKEEYWSIDAHRKAKETAAHVNGVSNEPATTNVYKENSGFSLSATQSVYHQIEKDVVRTDRLTPYYKGEDNVHVKTLMDIILNYLVYKPDIRYCQGMTDLLAPLLAALDDEAEAFWCFTKLVQSSAFYKPGKDHISVSHQIEPLRSLISLLIPSFYSYLESIEGGTSLMFCHRWLLVCLKREFYEEDALMIWEACWSEYQTTSFHLFICVAIMAVYGQKAIDRNMTINELMVFFNTLSHSIPRDIVLSQARGYLHQFSNSKEVSCLLYPVMNNQFWEREHSPRLACSVCKGIGSCSRTGFVTAHEAVC